LNQEKEAPTPIKKLQKQKGLQRLKEDANCNTKTWQAQSNDKAQNMVHDQG
jgi:hypothetical protein